MDVLLIGNMQEKKVGFGEDSNPILISNGDSLFIGVFDGMGGAGASECVSDYSVDGRNKTNAYVGSRIVRDALERSIKNNPDILKDSHLSEKIVKIIMSRYEEEKIKYPARKLTLRSNLIKEYPTTLAICSVTIQNTDYCIESLWAGDSRNYLWKSDGLFQISIDDLKGNLDPMQNLREDAQMSNCIHANGQFKINESRLFLKPEEKFLILSVTDGCFGYFQTPMDFEKVLLDSLKKSQSLDEWKWNLSTLISYVTADDFSFSIAAIGFLDFHEIKSSLVHPNKHTKDFFRNREKCNRKIRRLQQKISKLERILEQESSMMWTRYKPHIFKYMDGYEKG